MDRSLKRIKWNILAALIVAGGMVGGAIAFAQSDVSTETNAAPAGITFPIPELGGCTDKASCKAYCDESAHMTECVAFAQAHGLMNKEEATRAQKFASSVQSGGGPGGCNSPGSCKSYCEDVAHMEECVAFAEKQGFKGQSYEHGKKIGAYLKNGGTMPGGCTSRSSCEAYCGDFSHAQECFTFAQKAGITQAAGGAQGGDSMTEDAKDMPTAEQFQKLKELTDKGETPGGCKTKDECMSYCQGVGHFDECVAFGEKMGFMNKHEVDQAKQFHGNGPGGCNSSESCHTFCNDPANHDECFRFAEDHGLISPDQLKQIKEGSVRIREGLSNAPKEVQDCLNTTLGSSTIEDMQTGKLMPSAELGQTMRGCFEKFGGAHDPKKIFNTAPPQVTACLKEKLGADLEKVRSGAVAPTPEMADFLDRKSTRLNSSHIQKSRMPSSA